MREDGLSLAALQHLLPATYRLEKPLASGSFGQTFLAYQHHTPCVIKILALHRSEDWKCIDLFEREAKLLKHLDHPHIPNYIDSFTLQDNGETYFLLVQEYVKGKTLEEWVEDGRRFQYADILNMAGQAADILSYLHQFTPPIIHRDLKPSNLMLDEQGKLWIIDFGAVRDTLLTQGSRGSTIIGTFGYMPMEQYEGRAQPASDLYALGMTLIYLLTRQEPSQLPKRQLRPDFRGRTQVPEAFARILDKLVDLDLYHRYQQASKLAQDIARLKKKQSETPWWKKVQRLAKTLKFTPTTLSIAAVVLVLLGILVLVFSLGQRPEQDVIAPPETVTSDPMLTSAQAPAPWQVLDPQKNIEQLFVSESGGVWYRSYNQLYYKMANSAHYDKWTAEQVLNSPHFTGLLGSKDTLFVLGKHDGTQQTFAYSQRPDSAWQRVNLPPSPVAARFLFIDTQNNLWIAQEKQVWCYDMQKHQWQQRFQAAENVYTATQDDKGRLWWTSVNQLFLKNEQGSTPQGRLGDGYIQQIQATRGQVALSSSKGFHIFDSETRQSQHFFANNRITGFQDLSAATAKAPLWLVGTERMGAHTVQHNQVRPWRYAEGMVSDEVKAVGSNGKTLALAFEDQGLFIAPQNLALQGFTQQKPAATLAQATYTDACQIPQRVIDESQGSLSRRQAGDKSVTFFASESLCPVGTYFYEEPQVFYTDKTHLYQQQQQRILPIKLPYESYSSPDFIGLHAGKIWLSDSIQGNYRFENNTWKKLALKGSYRFVFQGTRVYALQHSGSGEWLHHAEKGQDFTALTVPENLRFASVYDAALDPKGDVVIGSSQGLILLHNTDTEAQQWQLINENNGLPQSFITDIASTPTGVWMLLYKKGLAYYDWESQEVAYWSTREGLISQYLDHLTVSNDMVWVQAHDDRVAAYKITDLKKHAKIQKNTTRNAGS